MNQELYNFYSELDSDCEGRMFHDLLAMSDESLEAAHDVIQWLFPLDEGSSTNKKAPVLDKETIRKIIESPDCMHNLKDAAHRFYNFYKLKNSRAKPFWVSPDNHNYLRITRILRSLKIFGLDSLAQDLYDLVEECQKVFPVDISNKTLGFWKKAMRTA